MGLQKTKTINGFDYSYWKIIQMRPNYIKETTRIDLALYKDKDTRDADPTNHVEVQCFTKSSLIESRADGYDAIKESHPAQYSDVLQGIAEEEGDELNWFNDATDV